MGAHPKGHTQMNCTMNRATFKAAVHRLINIKQELESSDTTLVEEITKTYFDECPGDYTPSGAVSEEFSYL